MNTPLIKQGRTGTTQFGPILGAADDPSAVSVIALAGDAVLAPAATPNPATDIDSTEFMLIDPDTGGGNRNIDLPLESASKGRIIAIQNTSDTGGPAENLIVRSSAGGALAAPFGNGVATITDPNAGAPSTGYFFCDGTSWIPFLAV